MSSSTTVKNTNIQVDSLKNIWITSNKVDIDSENLNVGAETCQINAPTQFRVDSKSIRLDAQQGQGIYLATTNTQVDIFSGNIRLGWNPSTGFNKIDFNGNSLLVSNVTATTATIDETAETINGFLFDQHINIEINGKKYRLLGNLVA